MVRLEVRRQRNGHDRGDAASNAGALRPSRQGAQGRCALLSFHLLWLLIAAWLPLQAQEPAESTSSRADELATLRRLIEEQGRRLTALEAEVRRLRRTGPALSSNGAVSSLARSQAFQFGSAWHSPANWDTIRIGMSESQVIAVLGRPTSIEGVVDRTFFYRGEVPGSGFVSGNVKLTDDRVYVINKPVF